MRRFPSRLLPRFTPLTGILWLGVLLCAPIPGVLFPQSDKTAESMIIKVDVEEVRLDVVVVDRKGLQVRDLTAEDFKVYQDRQQQKVTSARYISLERPQTGKPGGRPGDSAAMPPVQQPELEREEVQRTIAIIVDDTTMDFVQIYRTVMALRKYVTEQTQPGDLISILKTSRGNAAFLTFTSDREELLARIDSIRWNVTMLPDHRQRITPVFTDKQWLDSPLGMNVEYCINALQDMPGRKYLMLITPNVKTRDNFKKMARYLILADTALRANIVIHTLNIEGLEAETVDAENPANIPQSSGVYIVIGDYELPFSKITGGLFLNNSNFFNNGLGDVNEQLKGYYLVSYIPPENTFSKTGENQFHYIKIETRRKGATVHSRAGFYGSPHINEAHATPMPPLMKTMFSPFRFNGLNVSLASGYIDGPDNGYLLPTWMHIDGKNLGIMEEGDGSRTVAFKAAATTTDIDGIFQDYGEMEIRLPAEGDQLDGIRQNGINFTVSVPVKKPGGYYVRVAVEDLSSGAKGSAYQFIDVPDLKRKRLALSSLYIIDSEEDADWIRSGTAAGPESPSGSSLDATNRNPAYKDFTPGDRLEYMAVIYNAKTGKRSPPELESRTVLYRNGIELRSTGPETLIADGANSYARIPFRNSIAIDESMQPGDYVLQLEVKDRLAKEKQSLAAGTLDFRVTKQQ